jgi:hypothetical protein
MLSLKLGPRAPAADWPDRDSLNHWNLDESRVASDVYNRNRGPVLLLGHGNLWQRGVEHLHVQRTHYDVLFIKVDFEKQLELCTGARYGGWVS